MILTLHLNFLVYGAFKNCNGKKIGHGHFITSTESSLGIELQLYQADGQRKRAWPTAEDGAQEYSQVRDQLGVGLSLSNSSQKSLIVEKPLAD